MNYIVLGEFDSRKYGAYVFAKKPSAPKYVYKTQKLESSNGKHIYPNVRLDTVKDVYTIIVMRCIDSQRIYDEICADIYSGFGQQKLEDSIHPDSFSFAIPSKINVKHMSENDFKFELTVERQPQRYLKIGYQPLVNPQAVHNLTRFASRPKIEFIPSDSQVQIMIGNGQIIVNNATIGEKMTFDAETFTLVDSDGKNRNENVTIIANDIILAQNTTQISYTGVSELNLYPRWWTI